MKSKSLEAQRKQFETIDFGVDDVLNDDYIKTYGEKAKIISKPINHLPTGEKEDSSNKTSSVVPATIVEEDKEEEYLEEPENFVMVKSVKLNHDDTVSEL